MKLRGCETQVGSEAVLASVPCSPMTLPLHPMVEVEMPDYCGLQHLCAARCCVHDFCCACGMFKCKDLSVLKGFGIDRTFVDISRENDIPICFGSI